MEKFGKEMTTFIRTYEDVFGIKRRLKWLHTCNHLLKWHKEYNGYSMAELWLDESNRVLQIPTDAWERLNIPYTDVKE